MGKLIRRSLDRAGPPRLSGATKARLDALTDEEITAAALADPDNPPLTDDEIAAVHRIGRPPLPAHARKRNVTLRLSPDVIEHFKAGGPGWQRRIDETLRRAIRRKA